MLYSEIESFWSYAKKRPARSNGVVRRTLALPFKECEFRFNHRHGNFYLALLKLLREQPLYPCLLPEALIFTG